MTIERINPEGLLSMPIYTQVVSAKPGKVVWISGQVGMDKDSKLVGRDFTSQATQVYENLKIALASVGATFDNVVKMTIFLTDPRYREALAPVRDRFVPGAKPASTLVVVAALAQPEWLLEIEAQAVIE